MRRYLLFMLMVALISGGIGRAASRPRTDANATKPDSAAQSNQNKQATGDEIFQANCARCHMPPMSISQRTTGTVIMHMRARARLSREDEIQLLKFMAP
jgi:cytochrome c5